MHLQRYLFILAASVAFIFSSCSDAPRDFNSSLLGPDQVNILSVNSFNGNYNQNSTSFKTVVPTGASNELLLGKYEGQEASILIQFAFYLPDSLKNDLNSGAITITDGWVEFVRTYMFGDSTKSMDFSAHKITTPWTSYGFTSDSLDPAKSSFTYDNADISSQRDVISDSINSFHLTTQYLTDALKNFVNGTPGYGMYLKPTTGSQKVIGYQAVSSGSFTQPALKIVINKAGVYTDTLGFDGYGDVSVLDGELPTVDPGEIVMQSSLVGQSRIAFDVSSIPSEAVINKARLILNVDTLKTKFGTSYSPVIAVFNIADSAAKNIDSSFSGATLSPYDTTYEGNITGFVQKWVTSKQNQGIILSPQDGLKGMETFVFKGSNATEPWKRPRLEILYTIKK